MDRITVDGSKFIGSPVRFDFAIEFLLKRLIGQKLIRMRLV